MTFPRFALAEIDQKLNQELAQMQHASDAPLARRCRRLALVIGLAVSMFGGAVVFSWAKPLTLLVGANAGAGVLLAGLALALQAMESVRHPWLPLAARIDASVPGLLGLAGIAQGLSNSVAWLDPLLVPLTHAGILSAFFPMHPICSFSLLLAGCALLAQDFRSENGHAPSEYLALSLIALNLVPLAGHVYQVAPLSYLGSTVAVPWPIALSLLATGVGILLSRPSQRLMAIITDNVPGAEMLRRSLPQTLLVLVALNWIVSRGALTGWYDQSMVSPLLTLLNSSVILVIFWRTAATVNNEYRARLESAGALAEATSLLIAVSDNTDDPIFVKDREGRLIFANPATLRRIGKTREEAILRRSRELFIDPDEADQIDIDDRRIMQNGASETLEQTLHLPHGVRTYTSTKAPWFDQDGTLRGIIGISTDISARKEMERQLKQREAELETTISQRTATLRKLADHLESVREEEKRAIARELHDDMGASLTSLNMHLDSIYKVLPEEPKWADRISRIQALVAALVATTRRIQIGLRPIMLDLFGLKAGITEQLEEFQQRTGIVCKCSLPDEDVKLPHKLEITLYRMLQEALNNVAKHAQASQVEVILDVDEDFAALTVRDDGIGIPQERLDNQTTYGIRGLSERASFLGGTARVFASATKGTTMRVELPTTL